MKNQRYLHLALAVIAALAVLRLVGVSAGGLVLLAVVVACPLMMFFMMRNMGGMDHGNRHDQDHDHDRDHDRL